MLDRSDEVGVDLFLTFLESVCQQRTEAEASARWWQICQENPNNARDILLSIEQIIQDPPRDLIWMMQDHGWIMLDHPGGRSTPIRFYHKTYLAWLSNLKQNFQTIYDEQQGQQ